MATLTIRNLPEDVHDQLRREAAAHRHSMEEEARQMLSFRYRPRANTEEILKKLDALNAKLPPLPANAKMDVTDSFIAEKRIAVLFESGAISADEKKAWTKKISRYAVSLPAVEAFYEERRSWHPK